MKYQLCAVEGDGVTVVPLAVIRLQLQCSAEAVDGSGVVGLGELEEGPGFLSIHVWVED